VNRVKDEHLLLITLKISTKMQKYQRRQYYRLNCLLSFHYKDETKEIWNDGTILDISGGGIRFISTYMMNKDEPIECHIQLNFEDENKHIYVGGKIVDSIETEYDTGNYETRVEFENVSSESREFIIRFVFEEERKRRKKEKGM
jgi:c-di-GMP-binding flagellar brake protein YcgR